MQKTAILVNRYLLRAGICSWPMSEETLMELCEKEGFTVRSYSQGLDFFIMAHVQEHMLREAFVFESNDKSIRFIFLADNLSAAERIYHIAHELMHIVFKHPSDGGIDTLKANTQETEADIALRYFLAPLPVLSLKGITTAAQIAEFSFLPYKDALLVEKELSAYTGPGSKEERVILKHYKRVACSGTVTVIKKAASWAWLSVMTAVFIAFSVLTYQRATAPWEVETIPYYTNNGGGRLGG